MGKIALTGKAKIAIRRINKENKNQYSELGKQILEKLLKSSTDEKKIPNMKDFVKNSVLSLQPIYTVRLVEVRLRRIYT